MVQGRGWEQADSVSRRLKRKNGLSPGGSPGRGKAPGQSCTRGSSCVWKLS